MQKRQQGIDFTSSLYLGMDHSKSDLNEWSQLTTGKPANLYESSLAKELGQRLADLQGMERGILFASTLHLFWDLFEYLSCKKRIAVFVDEWAYPIATWPLRSIIRNGAKVKTFSHARVDLVAHGVKRAYRSGYLPVIMTDGWCTHCGKANPLQDFVTILKPFGGLLVVDDTQALGILGNRPNNKFPYGYGGGGIIRWLNVEYENIILGSSLAKGFGVPTAVLSGSSRILDDLLTKSRIRKHCSPPSRADLTATYNALLTNKIDGDHRRLKLWRKVQRFRSLGKKRGLTFKGGIFPVQRIRCTLNELPGVLQALKKRGFHVLSAENDQYSGSLILILRLDQMDTILRGVVYSVKSALAANEKTNGYENNNGRAFERKFRSVSTGAKR